MVNSNGLYPKEVIAKLLNLTERRVEQLVQKKVIPKAGRGVFDLGSAVNEYVKYIQKINNGTIPADKSDIKERFLKAQTDEREAKAALRQLELDRKKGELVTIGEVKRQWSARLVEFKAAMLEMPKRAAFRFTDADIRLRVEEELSAFVTETLARYSRGGIRAVADGDIDATEAAPVDNGKPVGRRKPRPKPKGEPVAGAVEDKPDAVSS